MDAETRGTGARPATSTVAQTRLVDELLAWGSARPLAPDGLVEHLLARMSQAVGEWLDLRTTAAATTRRPLLITKTRLTRLVCDGLQRDPVPYTHGWANARGTLTHAAIELDVDGLRASDSTEVAQRAWQRLATDRAGDPSSLASWLNARDAGERALLVEESAALLDGFREVWPELSSAPLEVHTELRLVTHLGGRAIQLQGVPDLVVTSPRRDGHARTLLVDLKTGMPRGQQDRDELRFYALLAALRDGVPPFRWATLYVTEGRIDHEDLSEAVLEVAAERVADAIRQAARIVRVEQHTAEERLSGGAWCERCLRVTTCPVAAARYGDDSADGHG
jgi:nucleotide-binding universal stress UspA family protein